MWQPQGEQQGRQEKQLVPQQSSAGERVLGRWLRASQQAR